MLKAVRRLGTGSEAQPRDWVREARTAAAVEEKPKSLVPRRITAPGRK
jgi:hypothetical protein